MRANRISMFLVVVAAFILGVGLFGDFSKKDEDVEVAEVNSNVDNVEEFDALVDVEKVQNVAMLGDFSFDKIENEIKGSPYILNLLGTKGEITTGVQGNALKIKIIASGLKYENDLKYEGGVITGNIYGISKIDAITYRIFDIVYSTVNSAEDKAISNYISKYDKEFFSIDSIGLSLTDKEISMSVNKEVKFVDFDSLYITKEEASKKSSDLKSDNLVRIANEKITVLKTGGSGYIVISVAEKKLITKDAFTSLINVLGETLEYNEVYEKFVNSHLSMKFTNEKTEDYMLELAPEKETYEANEFGTEPMIRLTVYFKD